MNLSPLWVQFLAERGFECVHWSSVGDPSAPDIEIMDYAADKGLVIFTHDLDFGALLANGKTKHPSVVQVRGEDILPGKMGEAVVRALRVSAAHLEAGALVTVDVARSRIRLLPI